MSSYKGSWSLRYRGDVTLIIKLTSMNHGYPSSIHGLAIIQGIIRPRTVWTHLRYFLCHLSATRCLIGYSRLAGLLTQWLQKQNTVQDKVNDREYVVVHWLVTSSCEASRVVPLSLCLRWLCAPSNSKHRISFEIGSFFRIRRCWGSCHSIAPNSRPCDPAAEPHSSSSMDSCRMWCVYTFLTCRVWVLSEWFAFCMVLPPSCLTQTSLCWVSGLDYI